MAKAQPQRPFLVDCRFSRGRCIAHCPTMIFKLGMPIEGDKYVRRDRVVLALKIKEDFMVETGRGWEQGKAGDYLVEIGEGIRFPVASDWFLKVYRKQDKEGPCMSPTGKERRIYERRSSPD